MKRIVLIISLIFAVLTSYAQIQTKFYECTLGLSNKVQCISTLRSKGFIVTDLQDGRLQVDNVKFGGFDWKFVQFEFFNNKLYEVNFYIDSSMKTKEDLKDMLSELIVNLYSKYSKYLLENDDEKDDVITKTFEDDKTKCNIFVANKNGYVGSFLSYRDSNLSHMKYQSEKEEL